MTRFRTLPPGARVAPGFTPPAGQPAEPKTSHGGRGRGSLPPGEMNRTEARYAEHLEARRLAGEIVRWWFEPMSLRLAARTHYRIDFLVMLADDRLEVHEVKGHWEDDARVKIKVAAAMFPFTFIAVFAAPKKDGGGWRFENVTRRINP